jgi:HAD superfamily hydrolase (TIGR01509 family)
MDTRIQAIIYDLDGVLVDSSQANAAFYNHILGHFGLPPLTPSQLDTVQMLTAGESIDLLFAGHPRRAEVQAFMLQVDNTPFLPLLRLMPQTRETLERLRPDYRTAIATNRGRSLPLVLKFLKIEPLFDLVLSSADVVHHKPHPECLQRILDHFHLEPAQALYVGDSVVDQETAARAGVTFAAYRRPELAAPYHLADHQEIFRVLALLQAP